MKFKRKQLLVAFAFSISFCNCQGKNHVDGSTDIQLDSISDATIETNDSRDAPEQGIAIKSNSTEMPSCSSKDLPDDIEQTITKQDDSTDIKKVRFSNVVTETNVGINNVKVSEDPSRQASELRNMIISEDNPCLLEHEGMPFLVERIVKHNRVTAEISKYVRYISFVSCIRCISFVSMVITATGAMASYYTSNHTVAAICAVGTILQSYALYLQIKSTSYFLKDSTLLCVDRGNDKKSIDGFKTGRI